MKTNYLVFTDLDGTLLDHHDYRHEAALPALSRLSTLDIPVILNSSKTPDELDFIAKDLHLTSPRIAENGSVISYPLNERTHIFGEPYAHICNVLRQLREEYQFSFEGFYDWEPETIAKITGLSVDAAARASRRQASEPLLWQGDEASLTQFRALIEAAGLSLKRGGRFWHVMGNSDKVLAMRYLCGEYEEKSEPPIVIALGDGPNDRDMLAQADIAVIVANPDGVVPELPENPAQRRIYTDHPGPEGWNRAINAILDE